MMRVNTTNGIGYSYRTRLGTTSFLFSNEVAWRSTKFSPSYSLRLILK